MDLGELEVMIGADTRGLQRGLTRARGSVRTFGRVTSGVVGGLTRSFGGLTAAVAGLAGAYGLSRLAQSGITVASSFERMERVLNTLTRGRGTQTLEEINAWALRMPVNTEEAVQAFVRMKAFGLDPNIQSLETLVDVAAVFGDEALPRVSRALGQMQTLGKISAEELNQLSEAGINARKYLTEAFGMSVEELQKSGVAIEDIIDVIMKGLRDDFGGAASDAMDTWQGLTATAKSFATEIQRRIMDAGIFDALKEGLKSVNQFLDDWLTLNSYAIRQNVPEYIERVRDAVSALSPVWKLFLGVGRLVWNLVTDLVDLFQYLEREMQDVTSNTAGFVRLARDIGAVFKFIVNTAATSAIAIADTFFDMVRDVGGALVNLGEVAWDALTFDFTGAASNFADLTGNIKRAAADLRTNLGAAAGAIKDDWEEMGETIRSPVGGGAEGEDAAGEWGRSFRAELQRTSNALVDELRPAAESAGEAIETAGKRGTAAAGSVKMAWSDAAASIQGAADAIVNDVQIQKWTDDLERSLQGAADFLISDIIDPEAARLAREELDATTRVMQDILRSDEVTAEQRLAIWGQYKDNRIKQIKAEAKAMEDLVPTDVLKLSVSAQIAGLEDEFEGLREREESAWGEFGEEVANKMKFSFNDLFFDWMTGKLDSFSDYWTSVWESLSQVAASKLSEELWGAMEGVFSGFGGGGGGSGGGLGGLFKGAFGWIGSLFGGGGSVDPFAATMNLQHGGVLREPVVGMGLRTGMSYSFAERGPELVTPMQGGTSMRSSPTININIAAPEGRLPRESLNQVQAAAYTGLRRAAMRDR